MLRHPEYAAAVERFFGVPGVAERGNHPFCEEESHYSNERVPLVIQNETLKNLTNLNEIDIGLYHEMRDCFNESYYEMPAWDPDRFETDKTIQLNHSEWDRRTPRGSPLNRKNPQWFKKFDTN